MSLRDLPLAQGLYDPAFEHDSCGVNFVVHMKGQRSNELVRMALGALSCLQHRGALGAEVNTGDGAGVLLQMPDRFLRDAVSFRLPREGAYASGIAFLPGDPDAADAAADRVETIVKEEGLSILGWRAVPVDPSGLGAGALRVMPTFRQLFVDGPVEGIELDRQVFAVRKRVEHEITDADGQSLVYFPSLSARTIVYKGMLTTPQLPLFFGDLQEDKVESAIALVHSRFSTNTFPSWPLAHPFRFIAHNGEINTVMGNRNWMHARESLMATDAIPGDLDRIFPICTPGMSDSASFDEALEMLHLGGYSLPHAVLMMIPPAWENDESMAPDLRAFYQFHASLMEPWDGPASIAFTDGTMVGAVLDRNGLRPSRYWVTSDDLVIMASEVGVVDVPPEKVVSKGRLQPGRMFLVDTTAGRIIPDEEIKSDFASAQPYQKWLDAGVTRVTDLPHQEHTRLPHDSVIIRQRVFGYTQEELRLIIEPMAREGKEPLGSMGTDTPLAVLSERPRLLFDYFMQLFAQVTNPPLDAIREELVTAVSNRIGREGNIFAPGPDSCREILCDHPVLDNDSFAKLDHVDSPVFRSRIISCLYRVAAGERGLREALDRIRAEASAAVEEGINILILSDRHSTGDLAPVPSLLFTSAVHHHLVQEKTRTRCGIVVETGEAREVHHFCLLLGFGASAINPYLAFDSVEDLIAEGATVVTDPVKAIRNYIKACDKGVLKVMSKMGISTVASYTGAQIFEAIGLSKELVAEFFGGVTSRIGGVGLAEIAEEGLRRHRLAHPNNPSELAYRPLPFGGEYQWRREGEHHLFNPRTVFKLQHATREGRYDIFKEYTALVNEQSEHLTTLRSLFRFRTDQVESVPLDEVESVAEIVKRFSTGAMSYGSISKEAHENLAIAMNRIGGKSNTGEGGEDRDRYEPDANGDLRRSAIKQVASGRFGVTSDYLTNADDLQIKMAQGAKPGEGGQLPANKVYPWIAETRHSTPGVGLISPPPHHDIYSIEDLAQLIHDLKNANPEARVHVKLVSEVGVGTVAAGVSKAHSDVVLISGHDGGTGAAPLTSLKHAGAPWELGLAETQQTLVLNGLRDRIVVQVDGQLKTGRDVVVGALLGAEEFGFATAPLVVSGCVMMRVCHLDTCPVGVATQNPELRGRFTGKPEFVVNFMEFIAEEVRELLASLGFRTLEEAVGRADLLDFEPATSHWKSHGLDLSPILHMPEPRPGDALHQVRQQDHGLDRALDQQLLVLSETALDRGEAVKIDLPIQNVHRTVGTILGHHVTKKFGPLGLPDDTISITFTGSAGQSFGAFLPRGITLRLRGDANDYTAKGLSGGRVVIAPQASSPLVAEENIIAGNVILYGATSGEVYIRGVVGERFCVRNSGAVAVVEGVGDHGCEYMTGGRVVVLGRTGRNFGAGMSGGIAYIYDPDGVFPPNLNTEMVELEELGARDLEWLPATIRKHHQETNSPVAERILESWDDEHRHFGKVMPRDFKRVLMAKAQAEARGEDPVEAIMASAGE